MLHSSSQQRHIRTRLLFHLFFFLISICLFSYPRVFLCAQEEAPSITEPTSKERDAYQDCMMNFNIANLNLKDPQITPLLPLLTDYFQCMAAFKDNINACDQLYWADHINTCKRYYTEYHGFYGRLLITRNPRHPQIISACMSIKEWPREQCIAFGEAWLNDNTAFCDKAPDALSRDKCKAAITGDTSFSAVHKIAADKLQYIKAIKSGNPDECKKLKKEHLVSMCEYHAGALPDERMCEKKEKFRQFQEKFCRNKAMAQKNESPQNTKKESGGIP